MKRRVGLGLALAGAAWPVLAEEGGAVRGGEHANFSRVVMVVEPTTEWSLETTEDRATIRFPGKRIDFDAAGVFAKMPKTRILAVRGAADAGGTAVEIDVGCDCRVSTAFVGARYLALDVGDRSASLPIVAVETPEAREERETAAVATAEHLLLRQIERAAGQGLVTLSRPDGAALPDAGTVALLEKQEQIDATTVFDRDGALARAAGGPVAVPSQCVPDARLDVGAWSNGMPLTAQVPALRRQLVGEFDAPDPVGVRNLARLYVRFGFGAEAVALARGFSEAAVEDAALLADLGRIVDGMPAAAGGPLAFAGICPGQHGLWLALGGRAPVFQGETAFAEVADGFAALPADLRQLLAPRFVARLLEAGRRPSARVIQDTAGRTGGTASAAMRLSEARLMLAEADQARALQALAGLAEAADETGTEALADLVALALGEDLVLPERVVTDLRAAVLLARGSEREAALRGLLVSALARQDLAGSVAEARAAIRALPPAAAAFEARAVAGLAAADPEGVGAATYAEVVLGAADLVGRTAPRDAARRAIAGNLVALGLPDPALAVLAPALAGGDPAARRLAAAAELKRGDGAAARALLSGIDGAAAAELRAASFALEERYAEAQEALAAAGLADKAGAYAWAAGDWAHAEAAAEDPARVAMAGYMAGRRGGTVPAAAADPGALAPEAAFREPLPDLARPSLDAARRLVATGPEIGGMLEAVLAAE